MVPRDDGWMVYSKSSKPRQTAFNRGAQSYRQSAIEEPQPSLGFEGKGITPYDPEFTREWIQEHRVIFGSCF